jgi:hypothetical protein
MPRAHVLSQLSHVRPVLGAEPLTIGIPTLRRTVPTATPHPAHGSGCGPPRHLAHGSGCRPPRPLALNHPSIDHTTGAASFVTGSVPAPTTRLDQPASMASLLLTSRSYDWAMSGIDIRSKGASPARLAGGCRYDATCRVSTST